MKLDFSKIADYARECLPLPSESKHEVILVYVNDFIGWRKESNLITDIELPDGRWMLIDHTLPRKVYQVVYTKQRHDRMIIGWEYLGIKEAGEVFSMDPKENNEVRIY